MSGEIVVSMIFNHRQGLTAAQTAREAPVSSISDGGRRCWSQPCKTGGLAKFCHGRHVPNTQMRHRGALVTTAP